jgi:osmotically-inducible protein OsmY
MSVMYPLAIIDAGFITTQVKTRLRYYHSISNVPTQIQTNRGVVTLEGKARNIAEKDLITQLVSDVYGVKTVRNQMAIEEAKGC